MKRFLAALMAIAGIGYIGSALADTTSSCGGYTDPVLCEILSVPSQKPPSGYYVKMTVNGQGNSEWTGMCMSNGSGFAMNNNDVSGAISAGILKVGENTITIAQCSDSTCRTTEPSPHNYVFILTTQSEGHYTASPSTSTNNTLNAYGDVCTVGKKRSIFFFTK